MKKKNIKWLSLILAIYGFPLAWVSERGNFIGISEIFKYNLSDMFFDFSRLAINFFVIFLLLSKFFNLLNNEVKELDS